MCTGFPLFEKTKQNKALHSNSKSLTISQVSSHLVKSVTRKVRLCLGGSLVLTDGALVRPRVVNFVVPNSLGAIHCFIKHHKLHVLLIGKFLLVGRVLSVLILRLGVFKVARHSERGVLVLDHTGTSLVLGVTLLLVSLDSDVSIDAIEVLFLFGKHFIGWLGSKAKCLNYLLLLDDLIIVIKSREESNQFKKQFALVKGSLRTVRNSQVARPRTLHDSVYINTFIFRLSIIG